MFKAITKLFDSNDKEIKRLLPVVLQINALDSEFQHIKDVDFAKKTKEFRGRVRDGETLALLLPEAFALVREAAKRAIGQRHYDVQLMAATVLAEGKVAEQKTGEGKTLSAVPALYLHSLTGKSVHLVTVNDYLARRDAGWMGPVFDLLGVKVASIISGESFLYDLTYVNPDVQDPRLKHLRPVERQEAYQADIVYGINSEFGFDYLRDNMAQQVEQLVQRGHYFAVVDEVDSVLIDEARTPHIISAPDEVPTQKYYEYATVVSKLSADTDYLIDEKQRTAHLTEHGLAKIETLYGVNNIYERDFDTVYHLEAALKAWTLFHREKDYIVKDNEVVLVDEFTGRLMPGRRLSEGIHQAIEAKEGVAVQRESKTLATVSLQNYFRMYEKLAGMTGTAVTEAEEFHKIYDLDVVSIPTHRPVTRQDLPDMVYKTTRAKLSAVVDAVAAAHAKGQPVLVGTTSIDKNEIVSEMLRRRSIKHEVLNAKNHIREAEIIARAGMKGAVTVATNMAGRGVDIMLGGEKKGTGGIAEAAWEKEHDEVLRLGGLLIIGTERHESRRIDNQLRGRAGRQGDPGTSQFYVALDDEIMRLFGGDMIANLMTRFNLPEDTPLTHSLVTRAIEQAQIKVEGHNFDIRKQLVEYDDVLNKQREIIYGRRRVILEAGQQNVQAVDVSSGELREDILGKIHQSIDSLVAMHVQAAELNGESANDKIVSDIVTIIPFDELSQKQLWEQLEQRQGVDEKAEYLKGIAEEVYRRREADVGVVTMREMERFATLGVIDTFWMAHLDAIDDLRQGIHLRGYGQRDPLVEYKNEAFGMFERLIASIDDEVVHRIYKFQVQSNSAVSDVAPVDHGSAKRNARKKGDDKRKEVQKISSDGQKKKLGRNDPCWCGSGKKFKKCHGR